MSDPTGTTTPANEPAVPAAVEPTPATDAGAPADAKDLAKARKADAKDAARSDARKARRGATIAGALTLPLVTLSVILLAVPLAVWYLSTVIRTLVVVIADIVAGDEAAGDANSTLSDIDPTALGGVTLAFAIVGAVLLVGGWLVSYLVLRGHRVDRPGYVTGFGIAVGLVISSVLTASVGALTGLIFGTARTVGQVLGNAALGIALTTIGSIIVTVCTGIVVWLWMERLFRAPAAPSASES